MGEYLQVFPAKSGMAFVAVSLIVTAVTASGRTLGPYGMDVEKVGPMAPGDVIPLIQVRFQVPGNPAPLVAIEAVGLVVARDAVCISLTRRKPVLGEPFGLMV
jgi:hypothetical protein